MLGRADRLRTVPVGLLGACLGVAVVLAALSFWGGIAAPGPLLVVGIALMSGSMAVFGLLTWWLHLSPLPSPARTGRRAVETSSSPRLVQRVAVLAALGGLGTQVATVWR